MSCFVLLVYGVLNNELFRMYVCSMRTFFFFFSSLFRFLQAESCRGEGTVLIPYKRCLCYAAFQIHMYVL